MQGRSRHTIIAATTLALAFCALALAASDAPPKKSDPTPANADNAEGNVSDRSNQSPIDQGNSAADIAMETTIREEIIATKRMSVHAENVKIITHAGKVTLRGPVDSVEEKRLIGDIADRCAGAENVVNQLEVNVVTSSSSQQAQPAAANKK